MIKLYIGDSMQRQLTQDEASTCNLTYDFPFFVQTINKKRKSFAARECPLMYPSECRERGITYKGEISASLVWRVDEKLKGESKV